MSKRLGWLHLTDLHRGQAGHAALWPNVKQALFDDLSRLHQEAGPWQLVLFSGDLVQQGTKEEFEQLDNAVIGPLWQHLETLGSTPGLLATTGNHDLVRPKLRASERQLTRTNGFREIEDEFFTDPNCEYRESVRQAFAEYERWWLRAPFRHPVVRDGLMAGDFAAEIDTEDLRVGIVGLNTAFLQLASGDFKGKLALDVRQLNSACTGSIDGDAPEWLDHHDACLLMTHHGPDWLDSHSFKNGYREINPAGRFALHLFGHMHEAESRATSHSGGSPIRQMQGPSLFGLERHGDPPTTERRHGYCASILEVQAESITLRHWPRKAFKGANGWHFERDSEGFVLNERDGGTHAESMPRNKARPRSESPRCSDIAISTGKRSRQAYTIDPYVRAARAVWDIVDLAGLPEGERQIAMQRLLLRQLFVPLRLTLQTGDSAALTDSTLQFVEQWRAHQRRAEARDLEAELPSEVQHSPSVSIGDCLASAAPRGQGGSGSQAPVGQGPMRLVILGDPGGGKTTLLRWLATATLLRFAGDAEYANLPDTNTLPEGEWMPVLVRCRDFDNAAIKNGKLTVEGVLEQTVRHLELPQIQVPDIVETLRQLLEQGRALLLVDGLDEISDPRSRVQFCRWLEKVESRFPSPIVATSRIVGYREMKVTLHRFEHATLAELTAQDKIEFLRRWCDVTVVDPTRRQGEFEKLKAAVDGELSDRISRLTGNPMLLTTLALVQRKVGKLPSKRHKLYGEAVGVLLNWRSDVDEPLDPDEALPQLEYVAFAMCDRGIQRLRRDELLTLLDELRIEYPNIRALQGKSSKDFLGLLEARTGLLMETGHTELEGHSVPVYEFRHLTFQEYLAALALITGRLPGRVRGNKLADRIAPLVARVDTEDIVENSVLESWDEVIRLCVASCADDDVDSVLLTIGGYDTHPGSPALTTEPSLRHRAVLTALCLADEPNVTEALARRILDQFAHHKMPVRRPDRMSENEKVALALRDSSWRESARVALLDEVYRGPLEAVTIVGWLVACVSDVAPISRDARPWLLDQMTLLERDLDSGIVAALSIGRFCYHRMGYTRTAAEGNNASDQNREHCDVPNGFVGALSDFAKRGPVAAVAGTWAMMWLSHHAPFSVDDNSELLRRLILAPETPTQALRFLHRSMQSSVSRVTSSLLEAMFLNADPELREIIWNQKFQHEPTDVLKELIDHPSATVRNATRTTVATHDYESGLSNDVTAVLNLLSHLDPMEQLHTAIRLNALQYPGESHKRIRRVLRLLSKNPEASIREAAGAALKNPQSRRRRRAASA